jgi:hypothetical protein
MISKGDTFSMQFQLIFLLFLNDIRPINNQLLLN